MRESFAELKPATASLKATKVPARPVTVNALALLAVKTPLVSTVEIAAALKLAALPTEVVSVVATIELTASIWSPIL
jgi:hypothetical protein